MIAPPEALLFAALEDVDARRVLSDLVEESGYWAARRVAIGRLYRSRGPNRRKEGARRADAARVANEASFAVALLASVLFGDWSRQPWPLVVAWRAAARESDLEYRKLLTAAMRGTFSAPVGTVSVVDGEVHATLMRQPSGYVQWVRVQEAEGEVLDAIGALFGVERPG